MKQIRSLADLFSFKRIFKRSKSFIGVEVDAGEIRAVELAPDGEGFRVAAAAVLPGPEPGPGGVPDETVLGEALRKLSERADFSTQRVVSALPGTVVIERLVHMPPMPAREVEAAVRFEAGQLIPVPLDDMFLRHAVLGQTAGAEKRLNVLVAAVPQDAVYRFHQAFSSAGLTLTALDLPALALWRIICGPGKGGGCPHRHVVVDVNALVTRCLVVEEGRLLFTRTVPVGGREFFPAATGHAGIPDRLTGAEYVDGAAGLRKGNNAGERAGDYRSYPGEDWQRETAVAGEKSVNGGSDRQWDYLLSPVGLYSGEAGASAGAHGRRTGGGETDVDRPFPSGPAEAGAIWSGGRVEELVVEIKRSLEFFRSTYADRPVDRLLLTGTAARRPDLPGLLSLELDMDVVAGGPSFPVLSKKAGETLEFDPALAVAAGLSLWGVG